MEQRKTNGVEAEAMPPVASIITAPGMSTLHPMREMDTLRFIARLLVNSIHLIRLALHSSMTAWLSSQGQTDLGIGTFVSCMFTDEGFLE